MTSNVRKRLEELIVLHERFYNSGSAGDLLILTLYKEEMTPTDNFEGKWLCTQVKLIIAENRLGHFPREKDIFNIVEYAISKKWPDKELVLSSPKPSEDTIVTMLGCKSSLKWYREDGKLRIEVPWLSVDEVPYRHAYVFKLQGVK